MTINELYNLIGLNKKVKIKFLRDFPFRAETYEVQDDGYTYFEEPEWFRDEDMWIDTKMNGDEDTYTFYFRPRIVEVEFKTNFPFLFIYYRGEEITEVGLCLDDEWNLGEAQIELIDNINN